MKKGLGYLAIAFVAFALAACSSSDSPTGAGQEQIQAEKDNHRHSRDNADSEETTSSEDDLQDLTESSSDGSSETTTPESSESGAPESSESTTPESSESGAPESVATTTTSSASDLTPLLDYELTQPFIDEGWRDECLKLLNEYRATEGLKPMALADAQKQQCAIDQAAADMADDAAHGHFGDCGESAQNSGPNFSTSWKSNATGAVQYYEMAMWENEKAKVEQGVTDYQKIGHYLNMKNSYSKVACGIAISADGKTGWFNMNFYY